MRLSPLLPWSLRHRLNLLRHAATDLRRALFSEDRLVVSSLHSPEELRAFTEAAGRARAERAEGGGTRIAEGLRAVFRQLEVLQIRRETPDAVTIVFANSSEDPLVFAAGQYLTVVADVDGRELRRAYSLSSAPRPDGEPSSELTITVKRLPGGQVSGAIHDRVEVGDRVRTLGPSGRFCFTPGPDTPRRLILVGAGSGITPLYSILRAALAGDPELRIDLIYGNRRERDIIFGPDLDALAGEHERLCVTHVLTRPPEDWSGPRGRLIGETLAATVPADPGAAYYLCGPEGMMEAVRAHLSESDVPAAQVKSERFFAQAASGHQGARGAVHSVRFVRRGQLLQVPDSQPLLRVGLVGGVSLKSSCTMGGCGACKVKLISGEVEMAEPNCLSRAERDAGEVLLCVSEARSPLVIDA